MEDHGATVVAEPDPGLTDLRADLGIPDGTTSCHIALVEGYAIQGHVPAEAVARLLADSPDAVGIAVTGMPADSPGMGGDLEAWIELDVLLIGHDRTLTPFDF